MATTTARVSVMITTTSLTGKTQTVTTSLVHHQVVCSSLPYAFSKFQARHEMMIWLDLFNAFVSVPMLSTAMILCLFKLALGL